MLAPNVIAPNVIVGGDVRNARASTMPGSRLYAGAISEYVGTHGSNAITERLNAVYGPEASAVDDSLQRAQFKTGCRPAQ